jgi:hypothetical protein
LCSGRKRWGSVSNVSHDQVLNIRREAIVVLIDQVKAPEMHTGWEKGNDDAV